MSVACESISERFGTIHLNQILNYVVKQPATGTSKVRLSLLLLSYPQYMYTVNMVASCFTNVKASTSFCWIFLFCIAAAAVAVAAG